MNSTTATTILSLIQAAGVSVVDFLAHTTMDGGALKQPTFWIGLVIAAAMGIKGYLTQGTAPAGEVMATKPAPPTNP